MTDILRELEELVRTHRAKRAPGAAAKGTDNLGGLEAAQRLARERELRRQLPFASDLFGEPAWDILLDLFIRHERQERVSIKSACIASRVPATTGLRWISVLEGAGLVTKEPDAEDGRRTYVRLTREGLDLMRAYFDLVLAEARA